MVCLDLGIGGEGYCPGLSYIRASSGFLGILDPALGDTICCIFLV